MKVCEIIVNVSKDQFHFEAKRTAFTLDTKVYLARTHDGSASKVLAVGDHLNQSEDAIEVHLFDLQDIRLQKAFKFDCFVNFFQYAYELAGKADFRFKLIRARIIFRGLGKFKDFFGGYHVGLLASAAFIAGARCVFVENENGQLQKVEKFTRGKHS